MSEQNWSQHHTFSADNLHYPENIAQLQEIVSQSKSVKTLGSRHSFNHIADTTEDLISLEKLNHDVIIDRENLTAVVNGGMTYSELGRYLHSEGYAVRNMASLPHITIAGACATATHGSGDQIGCLATDVSALEIVTADGNITTLSREHNPDTFYGCPVSLGGLGVIAKVTLDLVPTYTVHQAVYENLPLKHLYEHFDQITSSAYSVSFFTHWKDCIDHTWLKTVTADLENIPLEPTFFDATLASKHLHPLASASAETCTLQMGVPGPWHERLPHFTADHILKPGGELQTEYFISRNHAIEAFRAVANLQSHFKDILILSEVRTVAADNLWMSPFYNNPGVGIHFSWKYEWPAVQKVLPLIEDALAPYQPRPHWGKLFTIPAQNIQPLYEKLSAFQNLLKSYDPQGKFRNAYLDTYIFNEA